MNESESELRRANDERAICEFIAFLGQLRNVLLELGTEKSIEQWIEEGDAFAPSTRTEREEMVMEMCRKYGLVEDENRN